MIEEPKPPSGEPESQGGALPHPPFDRGAARTHGIDQPRLCPHQGPAAPPWKHREGALQGGGAPREPRPFRRSLGSACVPRALPLGLTRKRTPRRGHTRRNTDVATHAKHPPKVPLRAALGWGEPRGALQWSLSQGWIPEQTESKNRSKGD